MIMNTVVTFTLAIACLGTVAAFQPVHTQIGTATVVVKHPPIGNEDDAVRNFGLRGRM